MTLSEYTKIDIKWFILGLNITKKEEKTVLLKIIKLTWISNKMIN